MKNLNNTYVQVSKELFDDIQDMKKRQAAIPHYKAQVKPIEGFQNLSREEKLTLAKHNMDEVTKQYENEEEKGWISSAGYMYHDNRNAHVLPIIQNLFDVRGLSEYINNEVEASVEAEYPDDSATARNMCILRYVRFIDIDIERYIMDTLNDATDATECKFLYQISISKYNERREPTGCLFWLQSDKKITIVECSRSSRYSNSFVDKEEAASHWENKAGASAFPLLEWKKYEEYISKQ